jgi:hypothetical protein
MKKIITIISVIFLVSCAPIANNPTPTGTETLAPTPTFTIVPTVTSTKTPNPTKTPMPELTAADVGLPLNPAEFSGKFIWKPCYVFNQGYFHAGDMIYFPTGDKNTNYNVIAPADGVIENAVYLGDSIGMEINVKTPFVLNGKTVFYDIVHDSRLAPGLHVGSIIHKGDVIAIRDITVKADPQGLWNLDIAFRNSTNKQANINDPIWTGQGFISYYRLVQDDLQKLDSSTYTLMPTCSGNPIKNKNFMTPTPDSNFGMYP